MNLSFHERVLGIAERLVREHPHGRDILALVLDGADHAELEVRLEDDPVAGRRREAGGGPDATA